MGRKELIQTNKQTNQTKKLTFSLLPVTDKLPKDLHTGGKPRNYQEIVST